MTNEVEHLFRYLFAIHMPSLLKFQVKYFVYFYLGYLFYYCVLRALYIFRTQVLHLDLQSV